MSNCCRFTPPARAPSLVPPLWALLTGDTLAHNRCPCGNSGCLFELKPKPDWDGWYGSLLTPTQWETPANSVHFNVDVTCKFLFGQDQYAVTVSSTNGCGGITDAPVGRCTSLTGSAIWNQLDCSCCNCVAGEAVDMELMVFFAETVLPLTSCRSCGCQSGVCSGAGVNEATGEVLLSSTDLPASGFGMAFGQTRSFNSRLTSSSDSGNGFNWFVNQRPSLRRGSVGGTTYVVAVGGSGQSIWFQELPNDQYLPLCNDAESLAINWDDGNFMLTSPDDTVTNFDIYTGQFTSRTSPGGHSIAVTALTASRTQVATIEQSSTVAGDVTTEQYQYEYTQPYDSQLETLTRRRNVNGGDWLNIDRVVYTYYGISSASGAPGDLQTATTQVWRDGDWADTGTTYYRYWLETASGSSSSSSSSSSSTSGGGSGNGTPAAHLPKYVLNPAAYDRMVADGHDPLLASDTMLNLYADFYFEYDDQRRATKSVIKSGSQTFLFAYAQSGFTNNLNHWNSRTTVTLPDGNQNVVYANYLGQTMLTAFQSDEDQWIDYSWYQNSKTILRAHPSAITGFDEELVDLMGYDSSSHTFLYLRDNEGLIETSTYHEPSGNVASQSLQEGQLGTSIIQRSMEYCLCGSDCNCNSSSSSSSSSSSGSGIRSGIWFLSRETVYPSDSDPGRTIMTDHCYSFYDGTCAVKQHTITLPVIPTEQNGSGVADTRREYFDTYGNRIWEMDERGFIGRMVYDIPTGAMIQQVSDVDTGLYDDVPVGWTTPSGGGKNLVTDLDHDDQGRTTQSLQPSVTIDLGGSPITIRKTSWAVYDDINHITYSGQGFATGSAPDYGFTLQNPTMITRMDAGGRVNEQIEAIAPSTSGTLAQIIDAAGGGEAAFPQSSYTRWTTNQYTDCCLAAAQRSYPNIPDTGAGMPVTNYDETDYGYNVMKWRNRTVSPGGTITDVVYEARGLVIGTYVGTNDDGGTDTDPTGGGADPDNNMVIVSAGEFDHGTDGGDGNLTESIRHVNGTTTRVSSMTFDFRNRKITTDGEVNYFEKLYYDNLDRVVKVERYNSTALGNLVSRIETKFDDRGRVYQTQRYAVDPATGAVGNVLIDNMWFDQSGNVIKSLPAGSNRFTKTMFDSLGRATVSYYGYDLTETSYEDVFTVSNDVILEQVETTFDDAGSVIQSTVRKRYHNAPDSQKGALQDPSTTPKARVTYSAMWQDGIGRTVATADYGTNGGTSLSRPDTIPESSDTILVSFTHFDDAGNAYELVDPAGMVTRREFDDLGRVVAEIKNYKPDDSSSSSSSGGDCEPSDDTNVTTRYTYTPDGQQATMTAVNPRTTDQMTTWTYGTTLDDSDIASSGLLRSLTYPTGGSDVVLYGYNRQGERTSLTDQRGCVHRYDFDKLGRQIHDRVTTVGEGVDDAVLRLSTTYEVRGMVETLTSWNDADVNSGNAVNQCLFVYDDFQQLIADYQEHDGEVDPETTPVVQYGYEDGSNNTIRSTTLTYPNGRVLHNDYGTANGINDALSRIASLIDDDGTSHLADYSFVGLGQFVMVDYTEPDVKYTQVNLAGTNDPDTGDIYSGWNRFGRTKDCRWYDYGHSTDLVRLQHGYDRTSDRLWRADLIAQSLGKNFDELYSYDGLHRLKDMQRGLLNGSSTAVTNETFAQCWSLDSTSNWLGFREAEEGGAWTTVQTRTANPVNEITDITNSVGSAWVTPAYDGAGNTTTIPQPADPTASFTVTYDAWNRIVGLVNDNTSDTIQQNAYDPRNYRATRFDYTSGILSETRHFYYTSAWQAIEERLGSIPDSTDPERQQVWGQRYIDDLAVRDRDTDDDGSLDERLYGLQDASWNVVALVDTSTVVDERYVYSPFGWPIFLNGEMSAIADSAVDNEILFNGQRFDYVTTLSLFRNRYFDSITGRFISRDPLDYPDGPNEYAPWFIPSATDPTGLKSKNTELVSRSSDTFSLITVRGPQMFECAGFIWGVRFNLLQPAGPNGGYILQHVIISNKIEDCNGNSKLFNLNLSQRDEYWEAWRVAPNSTWVAKQEFVQNNGDLFNSLLGTYIASNPVDDSFETSAVQGSSCGEISFGAEYMYVDGPIPNSLVRGGVKTAGPLLWSSRKNPNIVSESVTRGKHSITVRWDCCPCGSKACPEEI